MRRVVSENDPYQREWFEPETFVERIAWALCAADQTEDGGYLNDHELDGLEALLGKMGRTCGSEKAESQWLDMPEAAIKRKVRPLKLLAMMERKRRGEQDPLFKAHLTRAYWPDYMGKAQAVWSIVAEHPDIAAAALRAKAGEGV